MNQKKIKKAVEQEIKRRTFEIWSNIYYCSFILVALSLTTLIVQMTTENATEERILYFITIIILFIASVETLLTTKRP